jgi:AcrR family transcriptional regulator
MGAARRCFQRNGFRETSMTDLFAESGLSSGAFYRYFSSKDELIIAIARDNVRGILDIIRTAAAETGSLGEVLADAIELVNARHAENGFGGMAVQVWAEALRNPELATDFAAQLDEVHAEVAAVVRRHQAVGALPAGVSAEALTRVLISTVPGYIIQLVFAGPSAISADVPAALRALWPRPSADVARGTAP